jgi:hypothetical protein
VSAQFGQHRSGVDAPVVGVYGGSRAGRGSLTASPPPQIEIKVTQILYTR